MQHRNTKDIELLRHQLKIMSVDDVSSWLAKFSTSYYVNNDIDASKLLNIPGDLLNIEDLHKSLKDKSPEEINADQALVKMRDERDRLSNEVTTNLLGWIQSRRFAKVKGDYESALYEAALTLANLNPANTIDFATQEPIAAEKRVVTSDRFQHDIDSLQTWLRLHNKNPWTNLPFSDRDIATIKLHLSVKKPGDPIEIDASHQHPGGNPDFEAPIRLARQLYQPDAEEPMLGRYGHFWRNHEPRGFAPRPNINWPIFFAPDIPGYDATRQNQRRHDSNLDHLLLFAAREHQLYFYDDQHSPIADLPTHQLPDWLSNHAAVKLSNGNFATVKCNLVGENTSEETRQIKIINPVSNEIIKTLQDSEPAGYHELVLLENDNVALYLLNNNDLITTNINIYNTDTGCFLKSIASDYRVLRPISCGREIITIDSYSCSTINIFDTGLGRLSRQCQTAPLLDHPTAP